MCVPLLIIYISIKDRAAGTVGAVMKLNLWRLKLSALGGRCSATESRRSMISKMARLSSRSRNRGRSLSVRNGLLSRDW